MKGKKTTDENAVIFFTIINLLHTHKKTLEQHEEKKETRLGRDGSAGSHL